MIEEGIKSGVCHAINQYSKANNKYMKDHNKSKTPSDLVIGMQTIYTDEQRLKKYHL